METKKRRVLTAVGIVSAFVVGIGGVAQASQNQDLESPPPPR